MQCHMLLRVCLTAYDVFKLKRASEPVKTFTGLSSALLRYAVMDGPPCRSILLQY